MRITIITQEDAFVLPENVELVLMQEGVELSSIIILDVKGALTNKKKLFIQGFGLRQATKMAFYMYGCKTWNALDRIFGYSLPGVKRSINAVARKHGVAYRVVSSVKSPQFIKSIQEEEPDLIISFSAPLIFPPELLAAPTKACVNLHCSYLPEHSGVLPSFWAIYHDEEYTGATVHLMDDRIDNGGILAQEKVPITAGMSMFQLIKKTKRVGGRLMCEVIKTYQNNSVTQVANATDPDAYHTWPTLDQLKEFRKKGGRLV